MTNEEALKGIIAENLLNYLKRKIKTPRSTIEINTLLQVIEENTVTERVTVDYPGWISVKDRLPDAGQYVLLRQIYHSNDNDELEREYEQITIGWYFKDKSPERPPYFYYAAISNYGDMVRASSMCPGDEYVTHWMPIPQQPKERGERGAGMTNEEAYEHFIDRLAAIKIHGGFGAEYIEATEVAIQAIEKQIPKKPRFGGLNPNYSPFDGSPSKIYCCPTCDMINLTSGRPKYCEGCGQAIDWTEEAK